jgi:hypothetical protein
MNAPQAGPFKKTRIETAIGSLAYGPPEHPFLIVGEQE